MCLKLVLLSLLLCSYRSNNSKTSRTRLPLVMLLLAQAVFFFEIPVKCLPLPSCHACLRCEINEGRASAAVGQEREIWWTDTQGKLQTVRTVFLSPTPVIKYTEKLN